MRVARWAVVFGALCLVVAIAAVAYAAGQAKAAKVLTADLVRAKRFEVVDEKGKVNLLLGTRRGGPGLAAMDASGKIRVVLGVLGGNPSLELWDTTSEARATLTVDGRSGEPNLWLSGEKGVLRASLSVPSEGGSFLCLYDGKAPRATVQLGPDGSPLVSLWDTAGKLRAGMGRVRLVATGTGATEESAESSLVLFDKEGKVLWRAP